MAETGESYSTAYRRLRHSNLEEDMTEPLNVVTNHDFGFSLKLPESWRDVGPDVYNSPLEVARYLRHSGNLHAGIVNIFWDIPGDSIDSLVVTGGPSNCDISIKGLQEYGIHAVTRTELELDSRRTICLSFQETLGDIKAWASQAYFLEIRGKLVCVNLGTSTLEQDKALYEQIISSFRAIEDPVGIVLTRDMKTPSEFVSDILQTEFRYTKRNAVQRATRMDTQQEAVVALVHQQEALTVIESVSKRSAAAGYGLSARVAG